MLPIYGYKGARVRASWSNYRNLRLLRLIRGPGARGRQSRIRAGAGIEVGRSRIEQSLDGRVGGNDAQFAAACSVEVRQRGNQAGWNLSIGGFEGRAPALQAVVVKGREEIANAGSLIVGRSQILLRLALRRFVVLCTELASGIFIGQVGERGEVKKLVDELDDRTVLGGFVRDAVNDAVRRDHDGRDAWALIERVPLGSQERTAG